MILNVPLAGMDDVPEAAPPKETPATQALTQEPTPDQLLSLQGFPRLQLARRCDWAEQLAGAAGGLRAPESCLKEGCTLLGTTGTVAMWGKWCLWILSETAGLVQAAAGTTEWTSPASP
ncbi:hypothetical protein Y1Q_0018469 [Alligator mississippiensis]|uniref:Uncharacterized protein n=1 Tax=Alligator mississippiensis TaxID=8496 RepID=A0A151PCB4_ALLMI|nr:hypothetical protein Y1Q_0018469 [Alligator mississippiensis]